MSKNLNVFLNDIYVGVLSQLLDGRTYLAFDDNYKKDPNRPTLSLSYKTILNESDSISPSPSMNLPPFFSNLLPEGKLRQYLAGHWGFKESQEFKLLTALKDDLPGAVILKMENQKDEDNFPEVNTSESLNSRDSALRFSLAGVQMKLSGNQNGDKLTIPIGGVGGHWIVKLPSLMYPNVVELEYSMLTLAKAVGVVVPDFRLIATESIENLPKDLPESIQGNSLISKRFDRTDAGMRIHMEDFAQVFSVEDKYDSKFNYQSIAYVIWQEIGLDAVLEFVRRLVFVVLTGNADMHLKNWSLLYPDGRKARLSPAYDLVSTIVYPVISATLPHKIADQNQFCKIDFESFKNFARIAGLPERSVMACVFETVDAVKENWLAVKSDLDLPASFIRLIDEHMSIVPIATERATAIPVNTIIPSSMTWPGSYVNWQVQLDTDVPHGQIVYTNQAEVTVSINAPRRMVPVLMQRQVHELLTARHDFANQLILASVGVKLYDEWRKESFVRLLSRRILSTVNAKALMQTELTVKAVFLPTAWRKIVEHSKSSDQYFDIDFVLENGELWTVEAIIAGLRKADETQAGLRTAELKLHIRKAVKLYLAPPEDLLTFTSGAFNFGPSEAPKKKTRKKDQNL